MEGILLGTAILASLPYFFRLEANYLHWVAEKQFRENPQFPLPNLMEFDFIIVGAGTAGCLLANKLSQDHQVLLLEAGGPAPSLTTVPAFRSSSFSRDLTEMNYFYNYINNGSSNEKVWTSVGKMVGGSYAHNGLVYNRGNSRDYDNWAKLTRDKSWRYKNVLPLFKGLERYNGPFRKTQRGKKGPIPIQTGSVETEYKMAAKELRYKFSDPNGPQMEGFSPMDFSKTRSGRAVTTCSIFIDPIIGTRQQLTVLAYAEVTKILFKKDMAIGVEYLRFGKTFKAVAKKEVILSAGVYGSPLLLFKSGIGPAELLSEATIPNIVDLPVGKNLEDHMAVFLEMTLNSRQASYNINLTDHDFQTYINGGREELLQQNVVKLQAYFVSSIAKELGESDWPDILLNWGDTPRMPSVGGVQHFLIIVVGRPKGSGRFSLNTTAYLKGKRSNEELGLIDFPLLENRHDVIRLLEGIRIALKITKTKSLKKLGVKFVPDPHCSSTTPHSDSDEYWMCVIKRHAGTSEHPVGTCRMGWGPQDKNSVVDSNFKVHGIRKLRIIDASVFPRITNSNTNAPTILLAARGASVLLKQHGGSRNTNQ